jgi:putative ABC transport system permease protein
MFHNLRYALRTFRRKPVFAASAIIAIALGIGATTAMFSVIDGVLLRPLPLPHSERLVNVWESVPTRNLPKLVAAPGNYYDWRTQNKVFSAIGAYNLNFFNLDSDTGEPERFVGEICDAGFFEVLGTQPLMGRVIAQSDDQPGHEGVVVLGYGVWKQRFGGDPNIIGKPLSINARTRVVIGVMPQGFAYPADAVMWAPLAFDNEMRARRDLHRLRVIARLADGVTLDRARGDMQTIARRLEAAFPDLNKDETTAVNLVLDDLVGRLRMALIVLLAAVGAVLLIACANVANLLLAKASARQREMAIRTSMGAGRWNIAGQMLTESLVLAFAGGGLGLLLAAALFRGLLRLAPATIPRLDQVGLNWTVAGLAMGLALITGVLFGLAPAWYASRVDLQALLHEGGRSTGSRMRLRGFIVAGQIAVTLLLLAGAGLLIRSFAELAGVDPGFNPDHMVTARLIPAPFRYRDHNDLQRQLASNIVRSVAALPGVQSAAIASDLPLLGNPIYIMRFEGFPNVSPAQAPIANYFAVSPEFFHTMGMRIVRGRAIAESDTETTPLVAVVNQTLADRYFPNQDPIGRRLEIAFSTPPNWRQIVGVVADVRSDGLDLDTPVQVYTSYQQMPTLLRSFPPGPITVLARTVPDPATLAQPLKSAILSVDRTQPVYAVQTMSEVMSRSIAERKLSLVVLVFFAVSALLLAAVGVYGVMSFHVAQRTGEIGIRMALGAQPRDMVLSVERQGMTLVAAGLVGGLAGSWILTRYLAPLLFRVSPRDVVTFGGASAVLVIVSLAACYLPARRASQVDPMEALRETL